MSDFVKVLTGLVGVAMVTTLVLPGRQTAAIAEKGGNALAGLFRAATGR